MEPRLPRLAAAAIRSTVLVVRIAIVVGRAAAASSANMGSASDEDIIVKERALAWATELEAYLVVAPVGQLDFLRVPWVLVGPKVYCKA